MAKKAIDYELDGRQDAAEGRSAVSSGVPRSGWQLAAWMKGFNEVVRLAHSSLAASPAVTQVSTVVVSVERDQPKMIQDRLGTPKRGIKRRMEALVATLARRQAARLWA